MKYKLLIAESSHQERNTLCHALNSQLGDSVSVFAAGSGEEALALFHQESPEIAILNIELPDINGLDVAQVIRGTGKVCAILFITDSDQFSYARHAIALRATDYIPKPYDTEKLIHSVREVIQGLEKLIPFPREFPSATSYVSKEQENLRLAMVRQDISAYIDAHYTEELSMKNVAHAMNYSDAYFCKLFKQCFQVNFSTYLNEYRIEKARALIANPRVNVKDVSTACGYTDANYFTRVFKRITGLTPSEYRLNIMEFNHNI